MKTAISLDFSRLLRYNGTIEKSRKEVIFGENQISNTRSAALAENQTSCGIFADEHEVSVDWEHSSRRESWTPEMKAVARQKALEVHKSRRENDSNE